MEPLTITINGDIKNFQSALVNVEKSATSLEDKLASAAKISGVAFAALTGIIGTTIHAYDEQEQAELRLNAVLKSTGMAAGITAQSVLELSSKLQGMTTFGDEAILSGQNILLTFTKIGKDTFPRATMAMLDMSQALGQDLTSSAMMLGKVLNNPTEAIDRLSRTIGLKFTPYQKASAEAMQRAGDIAGAQAIILGELEKKFGGASTAAAHGTGQFLQIKNAMGEVFEEIGKKLLPTILKLTSGFKDIFLEISKNDKLITFAANALLIGTAFSGIVIGLTVAASAFLKVRAVMLAMIPVVQGMTLSIRSLVGATGIGLLIVVLGYLLVNWERTFKQMQVIYSNFAIAITEIGKGIGTILSGVFTLDLKKIQQGMEQIKNTVVQGAIKMGAELAAIPPTDSVLAPDEHHTKEKYEANRAVSQEEYNKDLEIIKQRQELEKEALTLQRQEELESDQAYKDLKLEQDAINNLKSQKQIEASKKTELQTQRDLENEKLKKQVESNNQYLRNQQEYGTSYAEIARATSSEIFQGTKQAASDLAQLQQSENSKLKAIGKAAAVTDIIMNGILAAQRIFTGLSTIPIIGPALGAVGAAAAIAGSMERANKVRGMAQGGVVTGGIPGVDSVPILAQRNEIVAPAQNFNEVIGSVRAAREAERYQQFNQARGTAETEGGGVMEVIIGFKDDFLEVVEKGLLKRRAIGIGNL